jgi:hypothetical protein
MNMLNAIVMDIATKASSRVLNTNVALEPELDLNVLIERRTGIPQQRTKAKNISCS